MTYLAPFFLILTLFNSTLWASSSRTFDVEPFRLENGLEVYMLEHRRAELVSIRVYYKVGSVDEDPEKTGLAHYLEHLLFTDESNDLRYDTIKRIPGEHNAHTNLEHTCYEHDAPAQYLETLLRYQAGLMQSLRVPEAAFVREREIVLQELKDSYVRTSSRFSDLGIRRLFQDTPYGRPIIGEAEHIPNLTIADALAFYQKWYAPNNAVIVIGGYMDKQEVKGLVQKYFGHIPAKVIPQRNREITLEPFNDSNRMLTCEDQEFNLPTINLTYRYLATPFRYQKIDILVSLIEGILGCETFLIYKQLVKTKKSKIAEYSVDRSSMSNGHGIFCLNIILKEREWTDQSLGDSKGMLLSKLNALVKRGFTQEDLDKELTRSRHARMYMMDDLEDMVTTLGGSLALNIPIEDIQSIYDLNVNVTVEEMNATLRQIFDTDQYMTTMALPPGKRGRSGEDT